MKQYKCVDVLFVFAFPQHLTVSDAYSLKIMKTFSAILTSIIMLLLFLSGCYW